MNPQLDPITSYLRGQDLPALATGLKGLEKESLRVGPGGSIAQTPHPSALGAALTHPRITTDYSEALLELVTGATPSVTDALQELESLHGFVYRNLGDECLWVASMPCVLEGQDSIPIARYGTSNVGRMKHVYRVGLGFRYGRMMQAIAGVHFNYSPPERVWPALAEAVEARDERSFRDGRFMGMLRNLKEINWLICYLFGASPAVCKSFLPGGGGGLEAFDRNTWFFPYGTSLRLSDIGYSNRAVGGLRISYNSLDAYVDGLAKAIATPHPPYQRIGTHRDGEWLQLNENVLQIENEYYSFVRPKRVPRGNEKRTSALRERGIEYVELRSLDLDPWAPAGLGEATMRFLEVLSLGSLLAPSEPMTDARQLEQDDNLETVATRGRAPGVCLQRAGRGVELGEWALETLASLEPVAELLDGGAHGGAYVQAVKAQIAKVHDPDLTPSAHVLAEMREHGEGFWHFAMRRSQATADWYAERPPDQAALGAFEAEARTSLEAQMRIEAGDDESFEAYLARYFNAA